MITLIPAFLMFALSAYFAFLALQVMDLSTKTNILFYSSTSLFVGIFLFVIRIVAWIISYINKTE